MSQAVLIAVGIDWDEQRQILAAEMANRESRSAWREFLVGLKARGLMGVDWSSPTTMPAWSLRSAKSFQRPHGSAVEPAPAKAGVHFLRNALDHLPRKYADDCLQELRWLYDRRDLAEARPISPPGYPNAGPHRRAEASPRVTERAECRGQQHYPFLR